ncbi:MAG: DUF5060 domain-containing protein, partial [Lewinella sp.]|nr:DUF5060 domain-containing protein [Lewinella sp.]
MQRNQPFFIALSFVTIILFSVTSLRGNDHPGLSTATISGELKKWHKVTLDFDGPESDEQASDNPFLNYRLNVVFSHGDKRYRVPGYFAADGNAAETSATGGNHWRVHFAPDEEGEWTYRVSFRKGENIAVDESED